MKILIQLLILSFLFSCERVEKNNHIVKLIPVKVNNEYEYINNEGEIIINPQFSEATVFRNGYALMKTSGEKPNWGYITEDGKFCITPHYKSATVFSDDLAWVVTENGSPNAINTKGEVKIVLQDAEKVNNFSEGFAAYSVIDSSEVKWGFIDKEGKIKISPQFSNTGRFSEGKCTVENSDGKWGFINKQGKLIINYQFEKTIEMFINGKAIVSLNNKVGLIDENGKYSINPQFNKMQNDGLNYMIEKDGKFGWCDKEGKININPQFENAFPFNGNDLAAVKLGNLFGYIYKNGKIAINPQFDMAYPFNGNLALVEVGGKFGFINKEGKYVINPQFDDVSRDFLVYITSGCSEYESVETDYFNINAIVNRININEPEGKLSLKSNLTEVELFIKKQRKIKRVLTQEELIDSLAKAATYEIEAAAGIETKNQVNPFFSIYTNEHLVFSNEKITNDASFDFYVIANAYLEVQDGWYPKKIFNPNAIVQGYAYVVKLNGKGIDKEKEVKTEIEKSFYDFKKDEQQSTADINIYKKDNLTIKSFLKDKMIVIVISNDSETK